MIIANSAGPFQVYRWRSNDFRARPIRMAPLVIPVYRTEVGDSQTDGRCPEPTASSSAVAFANLWNANFTPFTESLVNGVGGRSLAGSRSAWEGMAPSGTPLVHFQESGRQNLAGQFTEVEFGDTFEGFVRYINSVFPGTIITTETATSFLRIGETDRDWETTLTTNTVARSYNAELLYRVNILANDGIIVYVADTANYIASLITKMENGYADIEEPTAPYHFNALGNTLVGLGRIEAMGFDIFDPAFDMSGVTVNADPATDTLWKTRALASIAENI